MTGQRRPSLSGKRQLLADLLFQTRLITPLSRLLSHDKLVILNYHRIRTTSGKITTFFDDGVFTVDEHQFIRQMHWLKRHARVLSESEIIEAVETGRWEKTNCPSVVVTFDDGYRDNYSLAYPVLKSLEIPAIFFICTEMICDRKLRWWDLLAYMIKKCRKPSIVVFDREYALQEHRLKAIADIQRQMKPCPSEHIDECIGLISAACEIDLPSDDLQERELMTQDQIRDMASHRMAIGSHTHTHQALSCLDDFQAELRVSKKLLEKMTERPVESVSYPFGLYEYIPLSIRDAAMTCGYRLGFTSNFGVNYPTKIERMALKRFSGELDRISTASLITVWPELFACKEEGPDHR